MTGLPEFNYPAFFAAEDILKGLYPDAEFVNPARLDGDVNPKDLTWEFCLRRDLKILLDCTDLVLLPGWEKSKGANLELHVAKQVGIKIWYLVDGVMQEDPP